MNLLERMAEQRRLKTHMVKEVFYSPQGEGHRVGTMNVFVRLSGCNLQCSVDREGFNCDTDFQGGTRLSVEELLQLVRETDKGQCKSVILTGGEPTLQIADGILCSYLKEAGYYVALETNGTRNIPFAVDWVSCSPKVGTPPVLPYAHEVRCVIRPGQVPDPQGVQAQHYFVSPACKAPPVEGIPGWHSSAADLDPEAIAWAVRWCEEHPLWRISLQTHKILGVR